MTTEFGKPDDTGQNENEGTTFGQTPTHDQGGATDNIGMTADQIEALRRRDEAAQAHIPKLESENDELRDRLAELETKLASATTVDEALARIANNGEQSQAPSLDQNAVTQIVDQVLTQKQTQVTSENNWNQVQSTLTETYGDWGTADAKVQERARELDISVQDATAMARNNPKAFLQLFVPQGTTTTDRSAGVRSGGSGQTVAGNNTAGTIRDHAYYAKMRRDNENQYWKLDTQLQMRRDLYS